MLLLTNDSNESFVVKTNATETETNEELTKNVPQEMKPFIRASAVSYSIEDLLRITHWSPPTSNHKKPRPSFNNSIHLIIQWYQEENPRRRLELLSVLHVNVLNPAINQIHFLQNSNHCTIFDDIRDAPSFPVDLFQSKLVFNYEENVDPKQRLTIAQVFRYANRVITNGYIIFANLDIILDQSLLLLQSAAPLPRQTVLYLSRYETDPSISTLGLQCSDKGYVGSHDVLIFQSSIPESIITQLPFEIGTWNIEVKIISVFVQEGYVVKNPCKSIRVWHYHSSQVRHRLMPSKKHIPARLVPLVLRPPEYLS